MLFQDTNDRMGIMLFLLGVLSLVGLAGALVQRATSRDVQPRDRKKDAIDRAVADARGLQQLPSIGMVVETIRDAEISRSSDATPTR